MNGTNHTKENAIAALGNLSIPVRSVMLQARLHRSAIMLMTGQAASDHGEKKPLPVGCVARLQQDPCCAKTVHFLLKVVFQKNQSSDQK